MPEKPGQMSLQETFNPDGAGKLQLWGKQNHILDIKCCLWTKSFQTLRV